MSNDINIGAISEALNNKIDIDAMNSTTATAQGLNANGTRTVAEVSDKSLMPSWYRVYSDGWCEQGGYAGIVKGSNIVSFLKNFVAKEPKKQISVRWGRTANADTTTVADIFSRGCTNSQVDFYSSFDTGITWTASGYIK